MNLNDFVSWALAQGSVGKTDGSYVGQCVSLINQYLSKVYGISAGGWGNAIDFASPSNPIRQYFDAVSGVQDGDIVVYGNLYGTDGHIVIAIGNGSVLEQNGLMPLRIDTRPIDSRYIAVLRRKQPKQGTTTMPAPLNERLVTADDLNRLLPSLFPGELNNPDASGFMGQAFHDFVYNVVADPRFVANVAKLKALKAGLDPAATIVINGVTYVPKS